MHIEFVEFCDLSDFDMNLLNAIILHNTTWISAEVTRNGEEVGEDNQEGRREKAKYLSSRILTKSPSQDKSSK